MTRRSCSLKRLRSAAFCAAVRPSLVVVWTVEVDDVWEAGAVEVIEVCAGAGARRRVSAPRPVVWYAMSASAEDEDGFMEETAQINDCSVSPVCYKWAQYLLSPCEHIRWNVRVR
jgi:hypothetical protein